MPTEQEIADAKVKADADADKNNKGDGGGDKDVTIKESELNKIKDDLDNYRKAVLLKKADEKNLDDKKGQDGASDKGGGNSTTIDEAKVEEIVKKHSSTALGEIYKSNESRAKRLLFQKYGELVDDAKWQGFISHFTNKRGKSTTEDIIDDFEDAMLLYKRSTGKLDEHIKSEAERARREGRIEGQMDGGRSGGGAGDKNESGKGDGILTPKAEEMARSMHVKTEKLKKVDASKDNVIDIFNK